MQENPAVVSNLFKRDQTARFFLYRGAPSFLMQDCKIERYDLFNLNVLGSKKLFFLYTNLALPNTVFQPDLEKCE
jgi:hypothetical protein